MKTQQKVVEVRIPETGTVLLENESGSVYRFNFNSDTVVFIRRGNNLIIEGKEGFVEIKDYFVAEQAGELPGILLEDDTLIPTVEYFEKVGGEIDTTPAVKGSGVGNYDDNSGDLLDGLDRLGSLGTDFWGQAMEATEELLAATEIEFPDGPNIDFPPSPTVNPPIEPTINPPVTPPVYPPNPPFVDPPPVTPPNPPVPPVEPPEPPVPPIDPPEPPDPSLYSYQARAVLHAFEDGGVMDDYFVDTWAITPPTTRAWPSYGGSDVVDVTYLGGDGNGLLTFEIVDGKIVFHLTDEAIQYFMNQGADEFIENYYTVKVGNLTYNMQVLVPNKGAFNSEIYHLTCKYGDNKGELQYGEWHAGNSVDGSERYYAVSSTNMDDVMTYTGRVENAVIHTGWATDGQWGKDLVTVNCHVASNSGNVAEIIAKGAGSSILIDSERDALGVVVASGASRSSLEASGAGGIITITNNGNNGHGITASEGAYVTVDTSGKNGSITIQADGNGASITDGSTLVLDASGQQGRIDINSGHTGLLADGGAIEAKATGAGGTIDITAQGNDSDIFAVSAVMDSDLSLNANAGINLTASGGTTDGRVAALYSASGSQATVTARELAISASASQGKAWGILASAGKDEDGNVLLYASNKLDAVNGVDITVTGGTSTVGLGSEQGGKNALTSGAGLAIDVTGAVANGSVHGIFADGSSLLGAEYEEINGKNVPIAYTGTGQLSENTITVAQGVTIKAESSGQIYGIDAFGGGKNTLNAGEAIDISVQGAGIAAGIAARGAAAFNQEYNDYGNPISNTGDSHRSTNVINTPEGIAIAVGNTFGGADGITATGISYNDLGGQNTITAKYIAIDVDSRGIGHGIFSRSGINAITLMGANDEGYALDIRVDDATKRAKYPGGTNGPAAGTAGMETGGSASSPGHNLIENKGSGNIRIHSGYVQDEQGNFVKGQVPDIAHGMYAAGAGTNEIHGGGNNLDVNVYGSRFTTGITVFEGGTTKIYDLANLNVNVVSDFDYGQTWYRTYPSTSGLFSCLSDLLDVQNVDKVNINVSSYHIPASDEASPYTSGIGLIRDSHWVKVNTDTQTANTIHVNVGGDGRITTGLWHNTGLNGEEGHLLVGGEATTLLEMNIKGSADDVDDRLYDEYGQPAMPLKNVVTGMYSDFHSTSGGPQLTGSTVAKAQTVRFNVTGENQTHAAGMWADFTSRHYVEGKNVIFDVSTTGYGDAHGMMAEVWDLRWGVPGHNTITADNVTIDAFAHGTYADAYGMKASSANFSSNVYTASGSSNTITSNGALTLNLTAETPNGYGYAMYATSERGGATHYNMNAIIGNSQAGTSDNITLNGDVYSDSLSSNTITTGYGADTITINGALDSAARSVKNQVVTGDGDDTLIINNGVVRNFIIDLGNDDDTLYLSGRVSNSHLTGGSGLDTLNMNGYRGGTIDLNSFMTDNTVSGFEIIDLGADPGFTASSDTLTFNGSLFSFGIDNPLADFFDSGTSAGLENTLKNGTVLRVHGDAGDAVSLGGSWAYTSQTVRYADVDYYIYKNGMSEEYMLLQQSLAV